MSSSRRTACRRGSSTWATRIATSCSETSQLIAERAGLDSWSFAFQSASATGEPWLGPDILEELDSLHERGVEHVLVCPIGFVSDHLEILWDIDVEARERAAELGLELDRIESLNDDPAFVRGLAELVRRDRFSTLDVMQPGRDFRSRRRPPLPRQQAPQPDAEGGDPARRRCGAPRSSGRCAASRLTSSRASRSASWAGTVPARRRCCG